MPTSEPERRSSGALPEPHASRAAEALRKMLPALREAEANRLEAVSAARMARYTGLAVAIVGGGLMMLVRVPVAAALAILAGIAVWTAGTRRLDKVRGSGKQLLVAPVADGLGLQYEPSPDSHDSLAQMRAAGVLPNFDRAKTEDGLVGWNAEQPFEFFEANLKERRTTTDSRGRTQTRFVTVFAGQCYRFSLGKRFYGETLVARDAGMLNFLSGRPNQDRVRLEDSDFEKRFQVYSTDQVEARYLLTPNVMARLSGLDRALKGKALRLAFSEGEISLAVQDGDLFKTGSVFEPLDDEERLGRIVRDFARVFAIMDAVSGRLDAEHLERD